MSQKPPPSIPQITHSPSPKPPSSPTSSTCSSTPTEDFSDSGEELSPTIMEPSALDYLTHGDLRSPGREFARERSLRKKGPHRHSSSTSIHSPPIDPGLQPQYPSEDDDEKKKLTPEEKSMARKKAKKNAKAAKRKAIKSQEDVKIPRKREDKRREDELAAVEASMAALQTSEVAECEEDAESITGTSTPDRQRRRSSNTLARPAKPRKTSSSNQGSVGGGGGLKSPKIGVEPEEPLASPGSLGKRSSPYPTSKKVAALTQFNVEEGIHERAHNIDSQMAEAAKKEALRSQSRGGKLEQGLEELEKRKIKQKQNNALKGVVEAAQERYEDEQLARLYGLK